ncbi:maltase 1 [Nasonia vitripennis]|uniref:alpha-glucosidase n=1 Tax=Nasonia vitripennis TaxID=7425 RepID=A0A7M7G9H4_NASVI|nr:maltase 1 [Nasonia vitripennis]
MSLRLCCTILFIAGLAAGEIKNQGWWKNTVFYQIYPRSFMDSNNDGIGDLKGITNRLEHFAESGIGGIWLSPIYASPMVDFGYDISDFRAIDKTYGTMEDLEQLTAKAKKLGVKVVLDFVPNHTSNEHPWFIKSYQGIGKYKDYYTWRRGRENNTQPPNNWLSYFSGSAWKYNATRDLWYFHQFEYRQPDLNFTNPNVRQEMEEILRFWLSKGIDGFRVDAVPHIFEKEGFPDEPLSHKPGVTSQNHNYLEHIYVKDDQRSYDLIKTWRKVLDDWSDSHNEDEKVIMTEAYASLDNTIKWYDYGSNIPFNFNFITNVDNSSKPSDFKKVIDDWITRTPSYGSANWVMGNHDNSRIATRYPGRADQMTMLAMILPGVAVTYYGEEIGMVDKLDITWEATQDPQACNSDPEHYRALTRDPNRTPFQWDDTKNAGFSKASTTWLPVNDNYKELNLAKQKLQQESHYKLYQTLTKLRSTSLALKNGTLDTVALNNDSVLAVIRKIADEAVVLLINFSNDSPQSIDVSEYLPNAKDATVKGASVGSGIEWGSIIKTSDVRLPPKASIVFAAQPNV